MGKINLRIYVAQSIFILIDIKYKSYLGSWRNESHGMCFKTGLRLFINASVTEQCLVSTCLVWACCVVHLVIPFISHWSLPSVCSFPLSPQVLKLPVFQKLTLNYVYYSCLSVCACECSVWGAQKRVLGALQLEVGVSRWIWVLGLNSGPLEELYVLLPISEPKLPVFFHPLSCVPKI